MFRLDVGGFNPVLGKSYGEIAADSRSQHKSQGFGVARGRGEAIEFFKTLAGDAPVNDLFDGVITDWTKIKGSEAITQSIQSTISAFDFLQPHKSVTNLVQVHKALQAMPDSYWREQKQKRGKRPGGFSQRFVDGGCNNIALCCTRRFAANECYCQRPFGYRYNIKTRTG